MSRARTIQPLHGRYTGYIDTFDAICKYIHTNAVLTKEDLESWYETENATTKKTAIKYVNSLVRCGLLAKDGDSIRCRFSPPRARNRKAKNRKIIETIDRHVVFIIDILDEARLGVAKDSLLRIGKTKHRLSATGVANRRGWLQSAGMLAELPRGALRTTKAGLELLTSVDEPASLADTNPAEFGGHGEGAEHKKLKRYVGQNCRSILGTKSNPEYRIEFPLPSGDQVDVTAWTSRTTWHIEVKSKISGDNDIRRGLWQCIKYSHVQKKQEKLAERHDPQRPYQSKRRDVKTLLVVGRKLPGDLKDLAKKLDVPFKKVSPA